MKCKKCGANLAPGTKFCEKCGTKVEEVKVEETKKVADSKKNKCPKCGADNAEGTKFCENCGTSLAKTEVKKEEAK